MKQVIMLIGALAMVACSGATDSGGELISNELTAVSDDFTIEQPVEAADPRIERAAIRATESRYADSQAEGEFGQLEQAIDVGSPSGTSLSGWSGSGCNFSSGQVCAYPDSATVKPKFWLGELSTNHQYYGDLRQRVYDGLVAARADMVSQMGSEFNFAINKNGIRPSQSSSFSYMGIRVHDACWDFGPYSPGDASIPDEKTNHFYVSAAVNRSGVSGVPSGVTVYGWTRAGVEIDVCNLMSSTVYSPYHPSAQATIDRAAYSAAVKAYGLGMYSSQQGNSSACNKTITGWPGNTVQNQCEWAGQDYYSNGWGDFDIQ